MPIAYSQNLEVFTVKKNIHPEYKKATVACACGNKFETKSTAGDIKVEICSACHPFFSGVQKFVDTDGRVEKFKKRASKAKPKSKNTAKAKKEKA